ncbi:MAG: single-stranded DNA-binding protein [Candidatus Phlomobacter fragariae]
MANQNQCNFTGRIGLETHYTQGKTPIAAFLLAISKSRKNNNGQWIEKTTWISCKAFKKKAEYINNQAQKGSFIRTTATYQENKWTDKSGQQRTSPEFLINDFPILGNRKERKQQENQDKVWDIPNTSQTNNNTELELDFDTDTDTDVPF